MYLALCAIVELTDIHNEKLKKYTRKSYKSKKDVEC